MNTEYRKQKVIDMRSCNLKINYILFFLNFVTLGQGLQNFRTSAKFGTNYYTFSPSVLNFKNRASYI